MKVNEVIKESKSYNKNNYWKLFFMVLLELVITTALTNLGESFKTELLSLIYSILIYAITIPLSYGVVIAFIKNSRNDSISILDFISDGIKNFKSIWKVIGKTIIKLILPIILFIFGIVIAIVLYSYAYLNLSASTQALAMIAATVLMLASIIYFIYKAISYTLVTYVLYDNSELSSNEILEKSSHMMIGNKWTFVFISLYISALVLVLSLICVAISTLNSLIAVLLLFIGANAILTYSYSLQTAFYNLLKDNL